MLLLSYDFVNIVKCSVETGGRLCYYFFKMPHTNTKIWIANFRQRFFFFSKLLVLDELITTYLLEFTSCTWIVNSSLGGRIDSFLHSWRFVGSRKSCLSVLRSLRFPCRSRELEEHNSVFFLRRFLPMLKVKLAICSKRWNSLFIFQ